MADKYKVELNLPGNETKVVEPTTYLTPEKAAFIPRSVRLEVSQTGKLPDAPLRTLIEASVLLADIREYF